MANKRATTKQPEAMKIPQFTLGERLAKARSDAGFTQEEMAYELDVSHSAIAKWERMKGQPRDFMARMQQWSDLTNVPVWWLLGIPQESNLRESSTRSNRSGPGRSFASGARPVQPQIAA